MIRGVSREIIEIADTGSNYFEKALLFVRPGMTPEESKSLSEEGTKLVKGLVPGSSAYRRPQKQNVPLIAAISAIAGGFITYLVMLFL